MRVPGQQIPIATCDINHCGDLVIGMHIPKPSLGRIVHYRGKQGHHATRAAIVTATEDTLDLRGVEAGHVPPLDDILHVHLWVFTPGESGGFPEYNVQPGDEPGQWTWPPRV